MFDFDVVNETVYVYNRIANEYSNAWFDHPPTELLDKFIEHLGKNQLVLDAACGSGRDTQYFLDKNIRSVGVDLSKGMLKEARIRVPDGNFIQMDVRHLAFAYNCFDGVWASAILVHIPPNNLTSVLKSIYKILNDRGLLFLAVHEVSTQNTKERIDSDGRYFVAYSENTMLNALHETGFVGEIIQHNISHRSIYGNAPVVNWLNIWARRGN